jgi:hypothetical protein
MKLWHALLVLAIAYFAIWTSNNVKFVGNVVG